MLQRDCEHQRISIIILTYLNKITALRAGKYLIYGHNFNPEIDNFPKFCKSIFDL